jgi:hypothetical protein
MNVLSRFCGFSPLQLAPSLCQSFYQYPPLISPGPTGKEPPLPGLPSHLHSLNGRLSSSPGFFVLLEIGHNVVHNALDILFGFSVFLVILMSTVFLIIEIIFFPSDSCGWV